MKMIFVRYKPGYKAYHAYIPATGHVHITCDVVFDEAAQWDWGREAEDGGADDQDPFEVEFMTVPPAGDPKPAQDASPLGAPPGDPTSSPVPSLAPVEFVLPPSSTPDLEDDHDGAPLRFHMLGDSVVPGLALRELGNELHAMSVEEPASLVEAEREDCWHSAMVEELRSIQDNSTWRVVDLPTSYRAIGL
ncbi:hypothetical protein E2562_023623 [Oryza meyeriana var. granulata]|uniref:Retroviral polymerase SH3-like domain-containing protein n=1 Tax=Oryza meyeriana var. granulata TaxID=110450 RepID=A0A6G1FBV3_9ORYZ|nr:hypothetical protein E2562_023623 [Oryza meyeriana var. granulata]